MSVTLVPEAFFYSLLANFAMQTASYITNSKKICKEILSSFVLFLVSTMKPETIQINLPRSQRLSLAWGLGKGHGDEVALLHPVFSQIYIWAPTFCQSQSDQSKNSNSDWKIKLMFDIYIMAGI